MDDTLQLKLFASEAPSQQDEEIEKEAESGSFRSSEEDLSKQVNSLLIYLPIAKIEIDKSRLGPSGEDIFKDIDTLYLAFSILDNISECMDSSYGATRARVIEHLITQLETSNPEKSSKDKGLIANIVFDLISNSKNSHKMFSYPYYDAYAQKHKAREFRLIDPKQLDGANLYRVTAEGFLAYFSLLEIDSNLAHEFESYRVKLLIERGKYAQAKSVALNNRKRTIELKARITDMMFSAQRNPKKTVFTRDISPQIDSSEDHIKNVQIQENEIYKIITESKNLATDDQLESIQDVKEILDECFKKYLDLKNELLTINSRFQEFQDTAFIRYINESNIDLESDVLEPLLNLDINQIVGFDSRLIAALNPLVYCKVFDPLFLVETINGTLEEEIDSDENEGESHFEEIEEEDPFPEEMQELLKNKLFEWISKYKTIDLKKILKLCKTNNYSTNETLCMVYLVSDLFADHEDYPDIRSKTNGRFNHELVVGDNIIFSKVEKNG